MAGGGGLSPALIFLGRVLKGSGEDSRSQVLRPFIEPLQGSEMGR